MEVVIALGTNLGDRQAHLRAARAAIEADVELEVTGASRVYETAPVGPPQPHYLNAALAVRTSLGPEVLLERCLAIERSRGRVRDVRWGPRTIDLDLLWADDGDVPRLVSTATLTLPHPHLLERAFALAPLLDVRPDLAPRFEGALQALGGPPFVAPVEGWTSRVRLQ